MSAKRPENGRESSGKTFNGEWAENARGLVGFSEPSIDDMIGMHLVDCDQCRKASLAKPVGIGQKSGHCDTYWQLQLMRAQHEGSVNNIVAYTEYGDEARKGGALE
jgi:hypothetical protein